MAIYIVTDIKTVADGSAVLINSTQHSTRNGAEERYHTALAAAARSTQYPTYSAVLMTNDGLVLDSKAYRHDVTPPEPEPEEGE